ncbi:MULTISPECIES: hypothetical protein [Thermococcus]|uniref:Uncharacterized protein n=1 Tax=Thermococcus barossii TaxID=54077 RepID=A0A2Z2MKF0_9EURY|nr:MULTISPECIES: hypothetical protein [Thermococcus]ASJ05215.1 hypothetical protein A3L01_07460 [Thermococcus barossii]NJE76347.1 hypothetical protein [Thermococcus sp. ES12]
MTVEILSDGCQEMEHLSRVHTHMPEGHISGVNSGVASLVRAPNVVEACVGVRNIPPALSKKGL